MRLTKGSTAALLVFFILLAGASLPLAGAGPPTPEPLNALKATENTEGDPFSELSVPSVASVMQADAENVELVGQIGGASYALAIQVASSASFDFSPDRYIIGMPVHDLSGGCGT